MVYGAKVQQVITNPTGGLGRPQLALLKQAAIAACDSRDGVTDRVVEDPRSCTFDPGTLACTASKSSACLTPAQVEAARSIYAGVVNPRSGERIFPGPAPAGELQWGAYAPGFPDRGKLLARPGHSRCGVESSEARPGQGSGARAVARHRGHRLDRSESLRLRPPRKAAALARLDGRTNSAQNTIDYYEKVRATIGAERVKDSVRLFMAPGVDHCSGGEGTFQIDVLEAMTRGSRVGRRPSSWSPVALWQAGSGGQGLFALIHRSRAIAARAARTRRATSPASRRDRADGSRTNFYCQGSRSRVSQHRRRESSRRVSRPR